jgi:hypothetical protein
MVRKGMWHVLAHTFRTESSLFNSEPQCKMSSLSSRVRIHMCCPCWTHWKEGIDVFRVTWLFSWGGSLHHAWLVIYIGPSKGIALAKLHRKKSYRLCFSKETCTSEKFIFNQSIKHIHVLEVTSSANFFPFLCFPTIRTVKKTWTRFRISVLHLLNRCDSWEP